MTLLDVWYVAPLRRCNFKCSYCVCNQPKILDSNEWHREGDLKNHLAVMKWISRLPYKIRLRLSTAGEPFVSKDFLNSVANLSHAENLEFIEILTNGSYTKDQFEKFISSSRPDKLSLWMTYHPQEISLEKFLESAILAKDLKVPVVVHALLFPDSVESTKIMQEKCVLNGIPFHLGLGLNVNNVYQGMGPVPAATDNNIPSDVLAMNVAFPQLVYQVAEKPMGAMCSAGHDYIYINSRAEVFQCNTYSAKLPVFKMGTPVDLNFKLSLRKEKYSQCLSKHACRCVEDYQHLQVAAMDQTRLIKNFIPKSHEEIELQNS